MSPLLPGREPSIPPASVRPRAALVVAAVAGAALGSVDLLLQRTLPYPWANLANSSAVWAVVAFGYGAWVRRPGLRVAVGGVIVLVVAVAAYHLAATITLGDALSNLWSPTSMLWAGFGVLAGVVFGTLGAQVGAGGWKGAVAAGGAGAVCFAEAAVVLVRVDVASPADRTELRQTAAITALLGLGVLLVAARTASIAVRALLASVLLAALAFAAFVAAGFTGFFG